MLVPAKLEVLITVWKTMTNATCKIFRQCVNTYLWLIVPPTEGISCDHCHQIILIEQVENIHDGSQKV